MNNLPLLLVQWTFNLIFAAILARIILSFVIPMLGDRPNRTLLSIYEVLAQVTEPILGPIRRVLPALWGLDFSPLVAIILLQIIQYLLLRALT